MRAGGEHVHRVQGLAGGHKQAVPFGATKGNIGAVFRQPDHANAFAVRGHNLHAGAGAAPEIPIHIAANAGGSGGRSIRVRNVQLHETFGVARGFAVGVEDLYFAASACVGDIHLLVVGRETDAVGAIHLIVDARHLASLWIHAVDGLLVLLISFEAFVVAEDAVGRIGEPDAAIGVHDNVVGRIQALAFELISDDGGGAVDFVAHHAAAAMFAGKLAAFEVEGIAVAVAGG